MVEEIDPEDVNEKIQSGEPIQVVDIRSEDDFDRGHIPGAINIPFAQLPVKVAEYDWSDEIVVACPIGQSSIQAARLIGSFEGVPENASVKSMRGGYEDWSYDLEAETTDAPI